MKSSYLLKMPLIINKNYYKFLIKLIMPILPFKNKILKQFKVHNNRLTLNSSKSISH